MEVILHIAREQEWQAAQARGAYEADSLATEGFLHCSTGDQVIDTVNARFRGEQGLLLLCIDPRRTTAEFKFEPGRRANAERSIELFPHLYGPLNVAAVYQTIALKPDGEGRFVLPAALAALMAG